ncbi:MAG: hypothetical protein R2698_07875 [Microthrixaceae bacterium]
MLFAVVAATLGTTHAVVRADDGPWTGGRGTSTHAGRTDSGATAGVSVSAGTQSVIPRSGRSPHRGRGRPSVTCTFHSVEGLGALGAEVSLGGVPEGTMVWRSCTGGSDAPAEVTPYTTRASTPGGSPAGGPTLQELLVEEALTDLDIDLPQTRLSPPGGSIPNVDTWFWTLDPPDQSRSASAGGVTVTVTAVRTGTSYEIGAATGRPSPHDHTTLRCAASTPYRTDVADGGQRSPCTHRFAAPTRDITIDTTSTWRLRWSATNGDGGDLGTLDRTTTTPYHVQEKLSVIRR